MECSRRPWGKISGELLGSDSDKCWLAVGTWHFGRRNCFVAARHEASDLSVNQMFFLRIAVRGLYDKERRSPHKSPSVRVKLEICI